MLVHQKTLFNGVTTCWAWFFQYGLKELQSSDVNNGGCAPVQPNTPPIKLGRGLFYGRSQNTGIVDKGA